MKVYLLNATDYGYYIGARDAKQAVEFFCELTETKFLPETEDIKEIDNTEYETTFAYIGSEFFSLKEIMDCVQEDDDSFLIGSKLY